MSDDLRAIFNEEAAGYLASINGGLLKLELASDEEQAVLLKEMNRMAHSLKGAARAVGYAQIASLAGHMETIFGAAFAEDAQTITPDVGDALYDALDLIDGILHDSVPDDDIQAQVRRTLAGIAKRVDADDTRRTDSTELPAITDDSTEFPAIADTTTEASEELVGIFWSEVTDHLARLNDGLLQVEMVAEDEKPDLLREMNRLAHSMKGAARAVGMGMIETVSHYLEEVLGAALNDELVITPDVADALYDGLDLIENAVNGNPNNETVLANVLMNLERLVAGGDAAPAVDAPLAGDDPVPPSHKTPTVPIPPALLTSTVETSTPTNATVMMRSPEETLRVAVSKLDQLMADSSELLVARMQAALRQKTVTKLRRDHAEWLREWRSVRAAYIRLVRRMQADDEMASELQTVFRFLETNQRYLIEANRALDALGQQLAQDNLHFATLTDALQANVSSLRMMPFDTIIGSFQRVARDMARDLGKKIHLDISGTNVEIDKTVLDALRDPLMHLLRNAIDHGLEMPAERAAVGKTPSGHIWLKVEQRGSEIAIHVQDDGRGMNVTKIRERAIERGMLSTQEATAITDEDAHMLVFQSGFTTSDQVTALSGRGLGMDIVRTRVEDLRGRVSVRSVPGEGTTISINVPVSLTRLSVITVSVGEERYALPSVMVDKILTIAADDIFTAEGQAMVTLGERPMPLVAMAATLGVPHVPERGESVHVLAIQTADRAVAFEVDDLQSEIEVVLKPLGRELENAPFVAGAALLGSGDVMIVLDANDLVRRAAGMRSVARGRVAVRETQRAARTRTRVLVVDDSITTRTLEKNILEAIGFEVYVAVDGVEAWSRIAELSPDVVVSDVEMPNMNGLELCRRIKSSEATKDLPVVLLTSLAKPEQREAGLKAGANAYLVKSRFDQNELLETIQAVM